MWKSRKGLAKLPENLKTVFGEPRHVFDLLLTANRKLARADTGKVLEAIREQGFYLQMPPRDEDGDGVFVEHYR